MGSRIDFVSSILFVLLAGALGALLSLGPAAIAAEDGMIWQFNEFNDPDNKGRLTARLAYGVPETDNIQVAGVCDGTPGTSAKFSSVTFGTETGDLKEGEQVELHFTGGGFNHVVHGTVHGTRAEVGVAGVHGDIEHDDPLWKALLEKSQLDYFVPGYRASTLQLSGGKEKIKSFIESCRAYAKAILGADAAADTGKSEDGSAEKEAFEAAKELGTKEAWEAFLANYSTGFHADMARAYLKKLGASGNANGLDPPRHGAQRDARRVSDRRISEERFQHLGGAEEGWRRRVAVRGDLEVRQ